MIADDEPTPFNAEDIVADTFVLVDLALTIIWYNLV